MSDVGVGEYGGVATKPTIWLHELFGNLTYRWLTKNVRMRNDEHGIEVGYRPRRLDDVICGATCVRPGEPGAKAAWWFPVDISEPYEAACTIIGEHPDMPHIGVPLDCANQTCECWRNGSYHLVITSLTIGAQPGHIDRPTDG